MPSFCIGAVPSGSEVGITETVLYSIWSEAFKTAITAGDIRALSGSAGYGAIARVPLGGLSTGAYTLTFELQPPAGPQPSRALAFTVK